VTRSTQLLENADSVVRVDEKRLGSALAQDVVASLELGQLGGSGQDRSIAVALKVVPDLDPVRLLVLGLVPTHQLEIQLAQGDHPPPTQPPTAQTMNPHPQLCLLHLKRPNAHDEHTYKNTERQIDNF
jgi:hypothetical protein